MPDVGADGSTDASTDADDAGVDSGSDAGTDAGTDAEDAEDAPMVDAGEPTLARNVLLIIADDLGVDAVSSYDDGSLPLEYADTPNLAALCGGVRFNNAWSAPTCTPTRGTMLTGRYGFRTGLLAQESGDVIDIDEVTLPRVLTDQVPRMVHANIGKWHLGNSRALGNLDAPNTMGWSHYAGNISRALPAYDDWTKVVDGVEVPTTGYAMVEHTDDALAVIEGAGDDPWFVWFATNAPHSPFHLPPAELHSRDDLSGDAMDIRRRPEEYYLAMVEAFDSEVGRLLESVDLDETLVIFIGDNGTPPQVIQSGITGAKNTLYEGGLNVPLCAAGAGVVNPGRTSDALVHSVDMFATILESVGAVPPASDSVSLLPYLNDTRADSAREWVFSQLADARTRTGQALRDDRYKLIRYEGEPDELYDLLEDPFERTNLMPVPASDAELTARLAELEATMDELLASE